MHQTGGAGEGQTVAWVGRLGYRERSTMLPVSFITLCLALFKAFSYFPVSVGPTP